MAATVNFLDLNISTAPITAWPSAETVNRGGSSFRSDWSNTLKLLRKELYHLRPERVVLYMDLRPGQIRSDGMPRADASPFSPRVILAIETKPTLWMRFPCDTYWDWQDNVRAIALTLESLRAIERWGVMHGEQYEGMKALPARVLATTDGIHSPQEAAEFIAAAATKQSPPAPELVRSILISADVRAAYYQKAARQLHPDTKGGDAAGFHKLRSAARVLELNADLLVGMIP